MTTLREAAKLALHALDTIYSPSYERVANELRAAIAAPDPEPVAFGVMVVDEKGRFLDWDHITGWRDSAHEHVNECIQSMLDIGAQPERYSVVPLHASLPAGGE